MHKNTKKDGIKKRKKIRETAHEKPLLSGLRIA